MTPARLVELELESAALASNPLGDPPRRPVLVWLPPGHDGAPLPTITFLHGFTGTARGWTSAGLFQPTVPERLEALVASGEVPPFLGVFPDGMTALGGTQWIDSPAVGRYQAYVAEDVVALVEARFPTVRRREGRAVVGKSSGGYGALRMGRDKGDVFAHVGCHSGDAAFEYCYLPELPVAAAALLAATDPAAWLDAAKRRARETKLSGVDHPVLNILAMAAHYSPDPGLPLGLALPFERETARLRPEVWSRWLAEDPVRFVPATVDRYRALETVFLDCGTRDEYHLRWGTRMVVESLRAGGVHPFHEEFEDGHQGTSYRYEASVRAIAPRLARA
jgi:poly(3-hydroxybutyrate) depolymerase